MSFLLLCVSSFCFLCLVPGQADAETSASSLVQMAKAIEGLLNSEAPGTSSRDVSQTVDDALQAEKTHRQRRFGGSRPYTNNPYDLGPIGQCSYPQVDVCHFPYGYTVPELVARSLSSYNDVLNGLHSQLLQVESTDCADAMMSFLCKQYVAPQCISTTTVRYPSDTLRHCNQAASSCSLLQNRMESVCTRASSMMVVGDFSLTKCRVPSVASCDNSRKSPDWIVAQMEHSAAKASFTHVADTLKFFGDCKDNYVRLACTRPTCEPNGHLSGYRSSSECNTVLNCVSDDTTRNVLSKALQCDSVDNRRNPSAYAGRPGSSSSGDSTGQGVCGTACIIGISCGGAAVVLIAVLAVVAWRCKRKTASDQAYRRLEHMGSGGK